MVSTSVVDRNLFGIKNKTKQKNKEKKKEKCKIHVKKTDELNSDFKFYSGDRSERKGLKKHLCRRATGHRTERDSISFKLQSLAFGVFIISRLHSYQLTLFCRQNNSQIKCIILNRQFNTTTQ